MKNLDSIKKKIIYRSEYRGIKEMDILLGSFVKKYINLLSLHELEHLYKIHEIDDDTIFKWYTKKKDDKRFPPGRVSKLLQNFKI